MARCGMFLGILLVLAAVSGPARAIAVLDLRSGVCHDRAECTIDINGTVPVGTQAHLSAAQVTFGADDFFAYSEGMIFGNGVFPHAFDLSVNHNMLWRVGTMEMRHEFQGFDIFGPELQVSGLLGGVKAGAFDLATPLLFQANETYRFQSTLAPAFSFGVLGELQFSSLAAASDASVVPVPPTLLLFLSALIASGLLHRRHRRGVSDNRHSSTDHAVA